MRCYFYKKLSLAMIACLLTAGCSSYIDFSNYLDNSGIPVAVTAEDHASARELPPEVALAWLQQTAISSEPNPNFPVCQITPEGIRRPDQPAHTPWRQLAIRTGKSSLDIFQSRIEPPRGLVMAMNQQHRASTVEKELGHACVIYRVVRPTTVDRAVFDRQVAAIEADIHKTLVALVALGVDI